MNSLFTAENSALLLIDHQVGTMQLIKNLPLEVVKRNTIALAKTAKNSEHSCHSHQQPRGKYAGTP